MSASPPSAAIKRDRLHLRLDEQTKRKLELAAAYSQTSLSDFILRHALARAEDIIGAHETMVLSDVDRDVFFDAIAKPPAPVSELRKALRWYQRTTSQTK